MPHDKVIVYSCYCCKCSHFWTTRTEDLPKICPTCKSTDWDKDIHGNPVEIPQESESKPRRTAVKYNIWIDPIKKANPCHTCGVPDGSKHLPFCPLA